MKTRAILLLMLLVGVFGIVQAQQSSWNWPEDKKTAAAKMRFIQTAKPWVITAKPLIIYIGCW